MGVFSETILIIVAIIRGGNAAIFVNINSLLIIVGGVLATDFISFPSNKHIVMVPILQNVFKIEIYEPVDIICR
jgi:chemotaxis protein MotA